MGGGGGGAVRVAEDGGGQHWDKEGLRFDRMHEGIDTKTTR